MHKLIRVMESQKHLLVAISICSLLIVTTIHIIQSDDDTLHTAITLMQALLCCLTITYLVYSIIKRRRRYHADMEKINLLMPCKAISLKPQAVIPTSSMYYPR